MLSEAGLIHSSPGQWTGEKKSTLVYRIDVQAEINVQVGKFLKNIKRAGQNRRAGGKLSGKSINVQGENFLENRVKL